MKPQLKGSTATSRFVRRCMRPIICNLVVMGQLFGSFGKYNQEYNIISRKMYQEVTHEKKKKNTFR